MKVNFSLTILYLSGSSLFRIFQHDRDDGSEYGSTAHGGGQNSISSSKISFAEQQVVRFP